MLGKMTKKNLKSIKKLKPSLAVIHGDDTLQIILYVTQKDKKTTEFEAIGTVYTKKVDVNTYKVIGTSGAYPGFGSLSYQSLLIELSKLDNNNYLISDRESVTGYAEDIYEKMSIYEHIKTKDIDHSSDLYAHDCPEVMELGVLETHPLNKMYQILPTEEDLKIHKLLKENHKGTGANIEELNEQAMLLGEWVLENYQFLTEDMCNGYIKLNKNSIYSELNDMDF